jgi:predicted small integral membrane protein
MLIRLSKTALVAAASLFLLIVFFNNLTDYDSNFQFVRHVLGMDTTFPGNKLMWRALTAPAIHHAFYASIILWEFAAGALLAAGAWKLWGARSAPLPEWERAKSIATAGLSLSLLQWFVAFITVGGEWFVMWQSKSWNGQDAAFRMFACFGLMLVFLNQRDAEPAEK